MNKTFYIIWNCLAIIGVIAFITAGIIAFSYAIKEMDGPTVKLECPFEGGECPNPGCSQNTCREYQYDISAEGTTIYDGNRRVGFLPYDSTQALDKLMLWDNQ